MNDDKLNPTPGPWRVDKDLVLGPEGYEGNIVCVAPEKTFFRSRDFWEANANLIAAAPTMYEYILRKAKEGDTDAAKIIDSII